MSDIAQLEQQEPIQQQEPQEQQQQQEPQQKEAPDWVPRRMGELAAARRAAEQRAAEAVAEKERLAAELAQYRAGQTPTEPQAAPQNIEELARTYAERMVREQQTQTEIAGKLSAIEQAGKKEYGDQFNTAVDNLAMYGVGGDQFLQVLARVPGAEKVLVYLGKNENIDEAMRISRLDPVQMGIEMSELSRKAAKEMAKQVSKVPPPVSGIEGGSGSGGDGPMPDAKKDPKGFIDWRNKNARRKY